MKVQTSLVACKLSSTVSGAEAVAEATTLTTSSPTVNSSEPRVQSLVTTQTSDTETDATNTTISLLVQVMTETTSNSHLSVAFTTMLA
jgi:hypothetical protein